MLIELKDGAVKEISTDKTGRVGCDTCDYGSEYINEFKIELTRGVIHCEISKMYEYLVSEDYMMKLFLKNVDCIRGLTEEEFIEWLEDKLKTGCVGEDNIELRFEFIKK